MSTFKARIVQGNQGLLDPATSATSGSTLSLQRQVWLPGPHNTFRLLRDGETFVDSNYFKRYCYPQTTLDEAILELVSDDGSPYSDVETENVFTRVYTLTLANGSTYTDTANIADITVDNGNPAVAAQVTSTQAVSMRINGSTNATISLTANTTQSFSLGEVSLDKLSFANSSGSSATVSIILTIRSVSRS